MDLNVEKRDLIEILGNIDVKSYSMIKVENEGLVLKGGEVARFDYFLSMLGF